MERGEYENVALKLMLYNNKDRHLIMIEHFTDSTLRVTDGLFSFFNATSEPGRQPQQRKDGDWVTWDEMVMYWILILRKRPAAKALCRIQLDMEHRNALHLLQQQHRNRRYPPRQMLDKVFTKVEIEPTSGDAAWSDCVNN